MPKADKSTKVSLVKSKDRHEAMKRSIGLLEINPVKGKKVVLKPNFNTADSYPGSIHPQILRGLVEYLNQMGATGITIAERSGPVDSPGNIELVTSDPESTEYTKTIRAILDEG